jgi:hypothetical protein
VSTKIVTLESKPREQLYRLLEICDQLNDRGASILSEIVSRLPGIYPRYPLKTSVNVKGLRNDVIKVLQTAELVSEEGLTQMLNEASWVEELDDGTYLRQPKKQAVIFNLVRQQGAKE